MFWTNKLKVLNEEWIEEDVIETKSNNVGHKINYIVYEYKQKIKNKYTFEDIIQKKVIETSYEEKYERYEKEGEFNNNGEGYQNKFEQFKSSKDGKLKKDKKLIKNIKLKENDIYHYVKKLTTMIIKEKKN